ncbi:3-dehydroquinate synthase [Limibacillus halophilus]|uniref:3-dehydroquinate synthase n=1 Tax=Limibacillus halophilus TaxID=1579333 RepID=A0A839SVM1_9PROT|nr:3-dehydroquinate synthase [Limibacillus halophilus]MBB3066348.1 3-dehydroquinate synthase [Limibacillus halophilus]
MTPPTSDTPLSSDRRHKRLRLDLGPRAYDILIGQDVLGLAGAEIAQLGHKRCFVITDETVARYHLDALTASLNHNGIKVEALVLPAGERTKSLTQLEKLTNNLLEKKVDRHSLLIALGGGVIGDLTGFAAAVLLRGIDFVQVPTTLLAQVDSSVGGKTGVNSPHGKNLIGAFHQPRLVLADTEALSTLPRRELLAGYAEVVKYGLIDDPAFFHWLETHGHAVIDGDPVARLKAVHTSCAAKARIVAADERESGQRALLNLGHTFGHALEAETGYGDRLLHGEAVAIGMMMAFDFSVRLGLCPAEDAERLRRHTASLGLPTDPSQVPGQFFAPAALIEHMTRDKKVRDGRMTFILARGIGKAFITSEVNASDLQDFMTMTLAA